MVKLNNPAQPKFRLGRVVATPGALAALEQSRQSPMEFLRRHVIGDWGDLCEEDKRANDEAVAHEDTANTENDRRGRVLSAYATRNGEKLWIISEWSREMTTLLLPSEY